MTLISRRRLVPSLVFALAASLAAPAALCAAPSAEPAKPPQPPFGAYLAGLYAQETRDYAAAASFYSRALEADPGAPELLGRAFLMDVADGRFAEARPLAPRELRLDPQDAVAQLVLVVDRLKKGDAAGALADAERLPLGGIHRFARPLVLAWTRVAKGDLPGAEAALDELDNFNGFAPLKFFQLGLVYDFTGHPNKALASFKKTLSLSGRANWRLTDAIANFYLRHGEKEQAEELYKRFVEQNPDSELAESVLHLRPSGTPRPVVDSAASGLAEALFDLASVLNQPETVDLALVYDRFALELRPDYALGQLLLADILSAEDRPAASLRVLGAIAKDSPYSWSAQLRSAADLDSLGRTGEAVKKLQAMAAAQPKWAGASIQLGDVLREKKDFAGAAAAYQEAVARLKAAGMPQRWSLAYSLGIALDRSNHWDKAEAQLQHALQLQPDQPLVLNYLGYSWIDRGVKLHEGLAMIEKAVKLRPEDGYIIDSLGWAHYHLGQYKKAVKYLEKAVELVPDDPTINDHLGDAYWKAGRPIEARFQWRQALQFGPHKDEIKPIEAKLERGLGPSPARAGGG
ncbi:MAG TPA: tetratricopeptide repeat protein [Stellaceae bacterium]|nr:tetratricopeptide repeat protein [Stellaceae bacterium]